MKKNTVKVILSTLVAILIIAILTGMGGIQQLHKVKAQNQEIQENVIPQETPTKPSVEEIVTPSPKEKENIEPSKEPNPTETPTAEPSIEPNATEPTPEPIDDANNYLPTTITDIDESKGDNYTSEDDPIYSSVYLVTLDTVERVNPETTVDEFIANLEISEESSIKIYKGEEEVTEGYIGTGMKVVGNNGREYKISVRGDITGEGIANQVELTMIIRHIVGQEGWELEGINYSSGDITGDGKIDLVDVNKMINYIVYGTWEYEELETPNAPIIEVITEKGEDGYHINRAEVRIVEDKSTENLKTTYKIIGTKEVAETQISEGETVEIEGEGIYLITAYTYGIKGNRSKGSNQIIRIRETSGYVETVYKMNVDGVYEKESTNKRGKIGEEVEIDTTAPDGFTYDEEKSTPKGTIEENGLIELTVYFERNKYELNLTAGEGIEDVTGEGTYYYEKEVSIEAIEKAGYTFTGWTGDREIEEKTTTVQIPIGGLSLTANATINEYDIEYELNGGTLPDGQEDDDKYTVEEEHKLPTPEKPGYEFEGWTGDNGEEPEKEVTIPKGSTGDKHYEAHWKIVEYNIDYDLNGGTLPEGKENDKYTVEEEFTLPTPTKPGYEFEGWTGDNGDNPEKEVTIPKGSTGDKHYEAHWKIVEYNIDYDLDGGTLPDGQEDDDKYTVEEEHKLPTPEKPGYEFEGWTGDNGEEPEKEVTIPKGSTGDKHYEAHWNIITYKITYHLDEETSELAGTYTVESETIRLVTIPTPKKEGYTFKGWTGSNGDIPETEIVIPHGSTGDKDYWAYWEAIEYDIEYNLNGGTLPGGEDDGYTVEENHKLPTPTKPGYEFEGWTGDNGETPEKEVTIPQGSTGDKHYEAHWKLITYTIKYYLDGGKATNPETYTVESNPIKLNNPTKTGYTFTGWSETQNVPQSMEVTIPKGSTGNKEYWAHWQIIEYSIDYQLNGGTLPNGKENDKYTVEEEFTLPTPTRPGYEFEGWTGDNGNDPEKEVTIPQGSTGNKSYEANWKIVEYNIHYDLDGGTLPGGEDDGYTVEENHKLPTPTKPGYEFEGWTGDNGETPEKEVTIPKGSTGDKHYEANWKLITYTITYNLDGGQATNPGTYTVESNPIKLNNPTKTGYTFTGWSETQNGPQSKEVTIPKGSTGNKEYWAHWQIIEYSIDYQLNGGTLPNGKENDKYTVENQFTLPTPTRPGYEFEGWTGNDVVTPEKEVTIPKGSTGNKSYEAHWKIVEYDIDYNLDGGTLPGGEDDKYTVEENHKLPTPTKPGYEFEGWTGDNGSNPEKEVTIPKGSTGDKHYEAHWKLITYTIKYYLDGGQATNPGTYTVESNPIKLNNPTKTGYTFTGWSETQSGPQSKEVTIPKGSTGNKEYWAHWQIIEYSIDYQLNGGTLPNGKENDKYTVENQFTLPTPTRPGYEFEGWTGNDVVTPEKEVTIPKGSTGNKSYEAHWKIVEYDIDYNLDGGTLPGGEDDKYTVEENHKLPTPTKPGYEFEGWTGDNGETPEKDVTIPKGSTGDKHYEAHWKLITYTIKYYLDGGQATNPGTYTVESNPIKLNNPTKTGYTFTGWSETQNGAQSKEVTIPKGSTGNKEYWAHWQINSYTVEYNATQNGGRTTETSEKVNYGTAIDLNKSATKDGYDFVGWNTNPNAEDKLTSLNMETDDVTLYAIFKKDITLTFIDYKGTAKNTTTKDLTIYNNNKGTITAPTINTYTGWTARYWSTQTTATSAQTVANNGNITNITANATYYARYYKEVTVTFNLNGGTGTITTTQKGNRETNSSDITKISEPEFTIPEITTLDKPGYTCRGWNENAEGTGTDYTVGTKYTITENKIIYAKWEITIYVKLYDDQTLGFSYKDDLAPGKTTQNIVESWYIGDGSTSNLPWSDSAWSITGVTITSKIIPSRTARWFYNMSKVNKFTGASNIDTSNVIDMSSMFEYVGQQTGNIELDLSSWNVSNVQNMQNMFQRSAIKKLNLSNWDVSKVTTMRDMFNYCAEYMESDYIIDLNLTGWNPCSVVDMYEMFNADYQGGHFRELNLQGWNLEKCTNIGYMFAAQKKLESVNVSGWNVTNINNMQGVFKQCVSLKEIDISSWKMNSVTNTDIMFYQCENLDVVWVGEGFRNLLSFANEFSYAKINNVTFKTNGAIPANQICAKFYTDGTLEINNTNTKTLEGKTVEYYYGIISEKPFANPQGVPWTSNSYKMTNIQITSKIAPTSMNSWFSKTSTSNQLGSITGLENIDTSNVTDMQYLFYNCNLLTQLDLSSWNTNKVTNMNNMFNGCSGLTAIYVGRGWTSDNATTEDMFANCGVQKVTLKSSTNSLNISNTSNLLKYFEPEKRVV